jgi:uncharacterized repeat protein (TIGR01451 family)
MKGKVILVWLLLSLTLSALAQNNPVTVAVKIFVVNLRDGQEELVEATEARPGQAVEYRLIAVNTSDTTLPAGTVVITGPVPAGTTFIADSATPKSDTLLTEFSVDGTSFYEPPILVGEDGSRTVADPGTYRAVRWTLLANMEPQQEVTFVYRVTVTE